MLSPSDEAFIASIDWHSLRQSAEQVAQPHREVVADLRKSFTDVPTECGSTRIKISHEVAKANDMEALARAANLIATDPFGVASALIRALPADESSGRPSASVVLLRVVPRSTPRPGIFARTMMALGRPVSPAKAGSLAPSGKAHAQ